MDSPIPGWADAQKGLVTWLVLPCGLATPESRLTLLPHGFVITYFVHLSQQVWEPLWAGWGLTLYGVPGLAHRRSFMKCWGGAHGVGVSLGVPGRDAGGALGHSDLRCPSQEWQTSTALLVTCLHADRIPK